MISILTKPTESLKNRRFFILVEGEEASSHSTIESLVERINEDYVECQRIFEPDREQKKAGYEELTKDEQTSIENLLLNSYRSEDSPLDSRDIFYDH